MANNISHHVGFVPEPNAGRGTVGILWQCLTTIFLCVYTCLHLNIPPRPLSKARQIRRFLTWTAIGLLIPEFMCFKAIMESINARKLSKHLKAHKLGSISTKQAHFFLWGGLRIQHDGQLLKNQKLGDWILSTDFEDENSKEFLHFLLERVPSDAIIDDRSKADALAKVLSCSQALWVAVQIIGRLQQRLDISLLEVVSAAYVVLAIVAYLAWFSKPYGINVAEIIFLPPEFDFIKTNVTSKSYEFSIISFEGAFSDLSLSGKSTYGTAFGMWLLMTAFGGIHCAAWMYSFPSVIEQWLWRTSAIIVGVSATIYPMTALLITDSTQFLTSLKFPEVSVLTFIGLYALARLFLWVETFISFRSAPQGIYEAINWAQYIGHIGS